MMIKTTSHPTAPVPQPSGHPPPDGLEGEDLRVTGWLVAGQRAASQGDLLAALRTYADARQQCDATQAPVLAAELDRRLQRVIRALRPAAGSVRATTDQHARLARWRAVVLDLPPLLVLRVLAEARWFMPSSPAVWRRRAGLARALLDGLERRHPPVDALLRSFLLASPVIDASSAPIVARGLAAYAAHDELTSLHLLVPRVEALLRGLLPAATVLLQAAASPLAGPPCLDGLLRQAVLHGAVSPGLAVQLRAVLLAGGADGLRHQLAHGRLAPAACTRAVTQDVVLGYLRLSRSPSWSPPPRSLPVTRAG